MRTAVIVQARMGSKRFPGKVMADLCGKPVLWHVLTRARLIKADHYCVAAPYNDAKALQPVIDECDWRVYYDQCDENDVLTRFYNAAKSFDLGGGDVVVRITGDCPLLIWSECGRVANVVKSGREAYYSNAYPRTVLRGFDCEAFRFSYLEASHENATDPYDREHVTPYMQRGIPTTPNYSIDTPEDLELVRRVVEARQAA